MERFLDDCFIIIKGNTYAVTKLKDQELKQSECKSSPQKQNGKTLVLQNSQNTKRTYSQELGLSEFKVRPQNQTGNN